MQRVLTKELKDYKPSDRPKGVSNSTCIWKWGYSIRFLTCATSQRVLQPDFWTLTRGKVPKSELVTLASTSTVIILNRGSSEGGKRMQYEWLTTDRNLHAGSDGNVGVEVGRQADLTAALVDVQQVGVVSRQHPELQLNQ